MANPQIFNINAGQSFVDILARHFLERWQSNPEESANFLFLMPTRRACQSLTAAFIRQHGLSPTILPRIEPIADMEEDEIILTNPTEILHNLPPAISSLQRSLILTRLILQKPAQLGLADITVSQAYRLAENLATLIDLAHNQQLDFAKLKDIVPEEYAVHWQETLKLLTIITENWPQILKAENKIDPAQRRNLILSEEIKLWQQQNTQQHIVIAGSTAAFPLWKDLVKTVSELPNGEVYLYGLDLYLDEDSWQQIDENHPQFELKELLDFLHLKRSSVSLLSPVAFTPREQFVAECMRPATTTAEWQQLSLNTFPAEALKKLQFVNCDDLRQEASAIALIIRQTLETPEKTAALVTADRNLSRRVVAELKKWNIIADDSAGQPLNLTPIGIFLQLILQVIEQSFSQKSLLCLLRHPFTAAGYSYAQFNLLTRQLELLWRKGEDLTAQTKNFIEHIKQILQPLAELYMVPNVRLKDLFIAHIKVAEALADTDTKNGAKIIWKNDAGSVAAKFVNDFLSAADVLEYVNASDYTSLLAYMLSKQNVRNRFGMHPRVKILGPIEARLTTFDVTIIGEANEGTWPQVPKADMWMSRPMKHDFGMPLPEKNIGISAADFAHLLNAPEVYLTRAERIDGTPTEKSRWWLRMETVLATQIGDNFNPDNLYDKKFCAWAKFLDRAEFLQPIEAPRPCPPVNMRPRKLSASGFEYLMRDPYVIFAKYILKLHKLEDLDRNLDVRDYGNIVHKVIENFNNRHPNDFPENAHKELTELGEFEFSQADLAPETKAFWWPKFLKTVDWLVATESVYRPQIAKVHNETSGEMIFEAPAGKFTLTAKADRIDETKDGKINIIDYKTGQARTVSEVSSGVAPQLPIEGLIAEHGGFAEITPNPVESLKYWQLGNKETSLNPQQTTQALENTLENIRQLIGLYDFESQPYFAKPNPTLAVKYSDYDHLERFLEWGIRGDFDDDNR